MTMKILWSNQIRRYLSPDLRKKIDQAGKSPVQFLMEVLEDRSVPAYLPLLGTGESTGIPFADPGFLTGLIRQQPSATLNYPQQAYESVDASKAQGFTLAGFNGARVYNTEGPVITIGGGNLNLGSGIQFGRASSFGGSFQPGNEILVNGGGTLGLQTPDFLSGLTLTVESGSQVLLNAGAFFNNSWNLAGAGVGDNGAIQALSGTQVVSGNINTFGNVILGAASGTTLIINGSVNGVRSDSAFANFSKIGSGNIIFDNVVPQVIVSRISPPSTKETSLTFRVELTEDPQSDLKLSDLTVTNGTAIGISKISTRIFDYTVQADVAPGAIKTVSAGIGANVFYDRAYLPNIQSNNASIVVNRASPFGYGYFSHVNSELKYSQFKTIKITLEDGAGLGIDPATISPDNLKVTTSTGQILSIGPDPTYDPSVGIATYTIQAGTTWDSLGANGPVDVTVELVGGKIRNRAGTPIATGTLGTFTVDTVVPTITINGGQVLPPTSGTRTVTLTSSKPLNTIDAGNISALNGVVNSVVQTGSKTFQIVISPLEGSFQKEISLLFGKGAITDYFANPSDPFTQNPGYLFDSLPPQALARAIPSKIGATSLNLTAHIEFNVFDPFFQNLSGSGVDLNSLTVANLMITDPQGQSLVLSNFTKDSVGNASVEISPTQFSGGNWNGATPGIYSVQISGVADLAGNTMGLTTLGTFQVGTFIPTPTLSASPVSGVKGISRVTVSFATSPGALIDNLSLASFQIGGPATLSNLRSIGTNQYTVDVTPLNPSANVSVQIPNRVLKDNIGNENTPSNILNLSFNLSIPVPLLVFLDSGPTSKTTLSGKVTFSQKVTLNQLSLGDFQIDSGTISTFNSVPSSDGINYFFSVTVPLGNQILEMEVKPGIATTLGGSSSLGGSPSRISVLTTKPSASINGTIGPVNSFSSPVMGVPFFVQFTPGLSGEMDLANAATALRISKGATILDYQVQSINPSTGIVNYLVQPQTSTLWTDSVYQGHFDIAVLPNKIFDKAGNGVDPGIIGGFDVATLKLKSSLLSNDVDANLIWINSGNLSTTSVPGEISVQVIPTKGDGNPLSVSDLDTMIVPDASRFRVMGFTIKSVSNQWQTGGPNPFIVVSLVPETDVVGNPATIGPASIELKENSIFDRFGNPNDRVLLGNAGPNGSGYLSFLGIDRAPPSYTTTGLSKNLIKGTKDSTPITIRISYEDQTSGVDLGSLKPENLVLSRGSNDPVNYAAITGQFDPTTPNTYIYTLSPISTYWEIGNYTL